MPEGVFGLAVSVLMTAEARDKSRRAREVARLWSGGTCRVGPAPSDLPVRPARPAQPPLCPPGEMPRRRLGTEAGRIALLHAIGHIELNAIDLAFDMIARFAPDIAPEKQASFISDWISVGDDEARHFTMIADRLADYGAAYGDLPAHDGLWEAAEKTNDEVLARLSVAPLVLEARGLDVTPGMIAKLREVGDHQSADLLQTIYDEEIGHVRIGATWLKQLARERHKDPQTVFRHYVRERFAGSLKPPFNTKARAEAGLEESFYLSLVN